MYTTAQELLNHLRDAQRDGVDLSQVTIHLTNPDEIGFCCDKYNHIEDFEIVPLKSESDAS